METVGLAALIAIIWKVVDFLKYLVNRDWNAAVTQLSVWGAAVAVALLARDAEPFSTIGVVGVTFGELSTPAIILFALGLGSSASAVFDLKKAIDGHDSAATPALFGPPTQRAETRRTETG